MCSGEQRQTRVYSPFAFLTTWALFYLSMPIPILPTFSVPLQVETSGLRPSPMLLKITPRKWPHFSPQAKVLKRYSLTHGILIPCILKVLELKSKKVIINASVAITLSLVLRFHGLNSWNNSMWFWTCSVLLVVSHVDQRDGSITVDYFNGFCPPGRDQSRFSDDTSWWVWKLGVSIAHPVG